jgi:hypothetical protein
MADDRQNSKPSRRWSRLWDMVVSTLRDYVVNLRWKGEEEGITAVKGLIGRGPLYWPGLAVLAFAVLAAAYLSLQGQRFPAVSTVFVDETVQIPRPTLYLSLLVAALGWAYLSVGAMATSLGMYVLAASYVIYLGLSLGQGLESRILWLILIPLWLLALGAWGANSRRTRWRLPFLLLLSLIAAQYSYVALRLQTRLPPPWGLPLIAAIYFLLAANRWTARQRPIRPWLAFAVILVLFGSLYAASLWSAPAGQFSPYVVFVFRYLLYFLEIFWFWMGAGLIDTARTLAGWTLARIEAVVPRSVLARALAALSVGWSLVFLVLTYAYEVEGTPAAATPGWQGAVLRAYLGLKPSLALVGASRYHGLVNLAISIYLAVLLAKKRYSHEKLLQLVGVSLLAFFILYGYFGAFYSLSGAMDALSDLQPLLLFVALMFWEIIKAAADLATGSGNRAGLLVGCLLVVASISLFELASNPGYFALLLAGTTFLGAVYLGLPYLLYTFLYEQRRYAPVPARQLRLVFLLGMISAIPSLMTGWIFFAPGLWLLITLATVWRWGRWKQVWDGLTYLLATGLGFAVYYTYPLFVPIPAFATFLNQLAQIELSYTARRFLPWDPGWWKTVVGVLGAAAILGYVAARAQQSQGRRRTALLLLGVVLSIALLAVWEYALAL